MYYVYILSSSRGVLYTGVTNNMYRRLVEHRNGTGSTFTNKYNVHRLVYVETTDNIEDALAHEKRIKGWTRAKKRALVETTNPKWMDLAEDYFAESG